MEGRAGKGKQSINSSWPYWVNTEKHHVLNAVERKNERQTKQFKPKLLNQKVIKVNGQTYGRIMANSILLPYREGEWGQQRHWVKITKAAPSALV